MSWSISVVGLTADEAKAKLREANDRQGESGRCPDAVLTVCDALADALPACQLDGYGGVSISTYGHFHGEGEGAGTSNANIAVQHVNTDALKVA